MDVDPSSSSHKLKGIQWKPEYHVQHVKQRISLKLVDHTKLTYRGLVYGWFLVLQGFIRIRGDINSYIWHCKFVSECAMSNQFTAADNAYVEYERHVVSTVFEEKLDKFPVGDTLGVFSNFLAGNLLPPKPVKSAKKKKDFRNGGRNSLTRSLINQTGICQFQKVSQMMCTTHLRLERGGRRQIVLC